MFNGIVCVFCHHDRRRGGVGVFWGTSVSDGSDWVPAAVCSALWGISECSASRGDGRLSLCSADGARVPFPFSLAGGAEPRVRVWADGVPGSCPLEQVTRQLLSAGSQALWAPWGTSPAPAVRGEDEAYSVVYLSADLRIKVSLIIVRWQPVSSAGRLSGLRVRVGFYWGCLQSAAWHGGRGT